MNYFVEFLFLLPAQAEQGLRVKIPCLKQVGTRKPSCSACCVRSVFAVVTIDDPLCPLPKKSPNSCHSLIPFPSLPFPSSCLGTAWSPPLERQKGRKTSRASDFPFGFAPMEPTSQTFHALRAAHVASRRVT